MMKTLEDSKLTSTNACLAFDRSPSIRKMWLRWPLVALIGAAMSFVLHPSLQAEAAVSSNGPASPLPAPMSVTNPRAKRVTSATSKTDLVKRFRALADKQTGELNTIDDRIKKFLKESTDISLNTQDLKGVDRKFKVLSESLNSLNQARKERLQRQDLFNRMALQIDSQWSGQPLQAFMSAQCLDMAELELSSEKGSSQAGVFLVYLSVALREIAESNEDVSNFIEDFTTYASVLNPKSPVDFITSRSYTSGSVSYTAKPVDPKAVADLVNKKLNALQPPAKKAARNERQLELRLQSISPQPNPPAEESSTR